MSHPISHLALLTGALTLSVSAAALEYPVGAPQDRAGMEIAAVYLQPVEMEPAGLMRPARKSDIHLEADVRAMARNPNGFAEGGFVPYLLIKYELVKLPAGRTIASGRFMPMVANDGPHYGDNIKLAGPGKYRLRYTVYPPDAPDNADARHFGRHTDRLTGVHPWFHAFTVQWDFVYAGIGKKGGY